VDKEEKVVINDAPIFPKEEKLWNKEKFSRL